MAFSVIASAKGKQTTGAIDTTGADLIVLFACYDGGSSFSDSKSNTWTSLTIAGPAGSNTTYGHMAYCYAPSVGASHTFSHSVSYSGVVAIAVSGAAASPFDQQNQASSTGVTSRTTGSITPTEDNEILIAAVGIGGTNTGHAIDGGFTLAQAYAGVSGTAYGACIAYLIQTSAAAANPSFSWTNSNEACGKIASFKAAAGAATTTPKLIGGNLIRPNLVRGRLAA